MDDEEVVWIMMSQSETLMAGMCANTRLYEFQKSRDKDVDEIITGSTCIHAVYVDDGMDHDTAIDVRDVTRIVEFTVIYEVDMRTYLKTKLNKETLRERVRRHVTDDLIASIFVRFSSETVWHRWR